MLNCINDALICLVRNNKIQFVDLKLVAAADSIETAHHTSDGFLEDTSSFHLNEATISQWH